MLVLMTNRQTTRTLRTELKRRPGRGHYDRETIDAILDEARLCHLGIQVDGQPLVLPTLHARVGDEVFVHGAIANRTLEVMRQGAPCCLTVTLLDGLVLARSAFHHSVNFRSVVILGRATELTNPSDKAAALAALVEKVMPGRNAHCRAPAPEELQATRVVSVPIEEASAKVRTGPPIDTEEDYLLPYWAGVVPLHRVPGPPEPDPRLDPGVPFPHAFE